MSTARVRDIISRIVRTMGSLDNLSEIERKLFTVFDREGYDSTEVREAFDIILRLLETSEPGGTDLRRKGRPLRIFSPDESVRLTRKAQSWLLRRYHREELGLEELEAVMNAVVMQDRIFDENEIRGLARAIGGPTAPAPRRTIH
jgi:uncharacterized protein Smg (DUF494 family)